MKIYVCCAWCFEYVYVCFVKGLSQRKIWEAKIFLEKAWNGVRIRDKL
jgi:hypothetical protein